ncbi:hypothetical protein D3C81_2341920 [compost metagenome]
MIAVVATIAYSSKLKETTGEGVSALLLFGISAIVLVVALFTKRWSDRRNNSGEE